MANNTPSISLTSLDFDTIKSTFKTYLQSQERFADYNFDGSNMSVLLDLLGRNTFQNAFYLNMLGNEMWMDSALLRDSVVSHAKDLNYTPKSFKSAEAIVDITITSNDTDKRSIVIPKGSTFSSNFGTKSYTFTTGDISLLTDYTISNGTISFLGSSITLYEGYYVSDAFVYNSTSTSFTLSNKNIDSSSITVTVIEDGGASVTTFARAISLFDLNSSSKVFFIQGANNGSYEIIFGDGVSGRKPKDNSTIIVEYRICNGELPNGCNAFISDGTIDGESKITVRTIASATAGAVSESIESIKFNAPKHFAAQERAVTTEDYETLLKIKFPEINAVTAFGGEDLDPPQFGKVYVAVDLNELDGLPEAKKIEYYRYLKPRSPVSIDPVFVDPEYTYLSVYSDIKYDITATGLTVNDIKTIVISAILDYASTYLNDFNKTFRYSKLAKDIDNSQTSILSNETIIKVIKIVTPDIGTAKTFDVKFDIPLLESSVDDYGYTLTSTEFVYEGQKAILKDKKGIVSVVSSLTGLLIDDIGTINYSTGLIQISGLKIESYSGSGIKLEVVPSNKDISTINNVILNITQEDIHITVTPTR